MTELLQLRDTRHEDLYWKTFLAEPLNAELGETAEVKLLLSAGLLILIEGSERTALQILSLIHI